MLVPMSAGADAHDDHDDHGHGDDHAAADDAWVLVPMAVGLVIGLVVAAALGLGSAVAAFV